VTASHQDENPSVRASEWVVLNHEGKLRSDQHQAFDEWLKQSETHRIAYARAEQIWKGMHGRNVAADRQIIEARKYFHQHKYRSYQRLFSIAAMLALASVILWYTDVASYFNHQEYQTGIGEQQSIQLSDGSLLELNTDTRVAVHYSRKGREIHLLHGQALFTVSHGDDRRPFDVYAGAGKIRDISTRFDVRHLADMVTVAVLEGEVEVTPDTSHVPTRLKQGESISYGKSVEFSARSSIDINTYATWREGKLVFHDRPLGEVLQELGRYETGAITVSSPGLMNIRVSGIFPTDKLALTLQTIATTLPAKLTRTGPHSWQLDAR